jgi:hypothetical protein
MDEKKITERLDKLEKDYVRLANSLNELIKFMNDRFEEIYSARLRLEFDQRFK